MMNLLVCLVCLSFCIACVIADRCEEKYSDLQTGYCYKPCKAGYKGVAMVCWAECPPLTTDIGAVCTKKTHTRGAGKVLRFCPDGTEKSGALCYPKCRNGYSGLGPVCWASCKPGYKDDGALCRRDAHIYSRDVGNCPWHDKCGLCGGPWYNVCGKRRQCGGNCKEGYHNDGCTCRKNPHIYAKQSNTRGIGKPMVCNKGEERQVALCYPPCNTGYVGVGPVCWARCTGESTDTGTQCQKKTYSRGMGVKPSIVE